MPSMPVEAWWPPTLVRQWSRRREKCSDSEYIQRITGKIAFAVTRYICVGFNSGLFHGKPDGSGSVESRRKTVDGCLSMSDSSRVVDRMVEIFVQAMSKVRI